MNKKVLKIGMISLMVVLMTLVISTNVFALQPSEIKASESNATSNSIAGVGKDIVSILQTVGIVLSVIVLIVLGIKYMMGSAEEKAEYKKTMMPYIIGAALIFAASALAQVIYEFFTGISVAS